MKCRICGNNKANNAFEAREMMYGYRDVHHYFQCAKCDCLQITQIPLNLERYYDASYYSFQSITSTGIRHSVSRLRNRYALFRKGTIGKLLYLKYPTQQFAFLEPILSTLSVDSRFLDVGCGAGRLLQSLRSLGFVNLLGVDLFIQRDIHYGNALIIKKQSIHAVQGIFDVVMFHHSFEQLKDPLDSLHTAFSLLPSGGYCIIRIPVVNSYAWKRYGVNWVQLDAPRHLFLHSTASMEIIANKAGFDISDIVYDSTALQFYGSEQYLRDIPLMDPRSYSVNPRKSIFSEQHIASFEKRAIELNATKQGDQAAFYLRKE